MLSCSCDEDRERDAANPVGQFPELVHERQPLTCVRASGSDLGPHRENLAGADGDCGEYITDSGDVSVTGGSPGHGRVAFDADHPRYRDRRLSMFREVGVFRQDAKRMLIGNLSLLWLQSFEAIVEVGAGLEESEGYTVFVVRPLTELLDGVACRDFERFRLLCSEGTWESMGYFGVQHMFHRVARLIECVSEEPWDCFWEWRDAKEN